MTVTDKGSDMEPAEPVKPYAVPSDPEYVVTAELIPPQTPSAPPSEAPVPSRHGSKKSHSFDLTLCGDIKVRGSQVRPGFNTFITLCGDHKFDLRESQLPPGSNVTFFVLKLCGDVNVVMPAGAAVSHRGISLCGETDIHVKSLQEDPESSVHVKIWFGSLCGSLRVRDEDSD